MIMMRMLLIIIIVVVLWNNSDDIIYLGFLFFAMHATVSILAQPHIAIYA